MKQNIVRIMLAMVAMLFIASCGGGGSGSGQDPVVPCTNCDPVVLDGSTPAKAIEMSVGGAWVQGEIPANGNPVFFSVFLTEGKYYRLMGTKTFIILLDSSEEIVKTSDDENGKAMEQWLCSKSERYFIQIEACATRLSYHIGIEVVVPIIDPDPSDSDNDGVTDDSDNCPNTPFGQAVDSQGCEIIDPDPSDSDNDGVTDDSDNCPNTPFGKAVDSQGCEIIDPGPTDTDNDGVTDDSDNCPNTPMMEVANAEGCSVSQRDTDGDGVMDSDDLYPNCDNRIDADADSIPDCADSVLNDGSSMESAVTLPTSGVFQNGIVGAKIWYSLKAEVGKFYIITTKVSVGPEHDMSLLNSAGAYLRFNPDKSEKTDKVGACIYNWKCPVSGTYYILIDSCGQYQEYTIGASFTSEIVYYDMMLSTIAHLYPERMYIYDEYTPDGVIFDAKGIALGETQERILNNYVGRYDQDLIPVHFEKGARYKVSVVNTHFVDNVGDCNLVLSVSGREGGNPLAYYNPEQSDDVVIDYTSDREDWVLLIVKSWNIRDFQQYSIKVEKIN